jgi:hypothetical protein
MQIDRPRQRSWTVFKGINYGRDRFPAFAACTRLRRSVSAALCAVSAALLTRMWTVPNRLTASDAVRVVNRGLRGNPAEGPSGDSRSVATTCRLVSVLCHKSSFLQ